MPIYEYRCAGCGKRFERIVLSASAGAVKAAVCPKCGAAGAEKLVSRFSTAAKSGGEEFGGGDFGGGGYGDDFGEGGGQDFEDEMGGFGGVGGEDELSGPGADDPGAGLGEDDD